MTRTGRPKSDLTLAGDERHQLLRWSHQEKNPPRLVLRSKMILACANGTDNKRVAAQLNCAEKTVGKWRRRFVLERLKGLVDQPRSGRPPTNGPTSATGTPTNVRSPNQHAGAPRR